MTILEIVVDCRIRIPEDELHPEVAEALKTKFERKNPSFWMLRRKGLKTWGEPPILKAWKREGSALTFPRGAWSIVKEELVGHGVAYKVLDRREKGRAAELLVHFIETRDYQDEALAAALKKENCILRASTGAGKTTLGLAIAANVQTLVLVIVDSKEIAEEWVRRCETELRRTPAFIGNGKFSIDRITIALHQTLAQMKGDRLDAVRNAFGCVIADEVQICGADTYYRNIDRMPARYRFGLSDDHHRVDGKTFLVKDLFGPVAHKIGDKALLERGAIADLEVVVDPTDFEAPWYVNRPTNENGSLIEPTALEMVQLIDEMTANDRRSSNIAVRIADEVGKGDRFLVYTHRTEHARTLLKMLTASGVPAGLMLGGTDEFDRTRSGLLSGVVKAGVGTYNALGKGVNIPDVDAGYAATPVVTSPQRWRQAKGRVIRSKSDGRAARFWVAWDGKVFGDAPLRKLKKWHRDKVRVAVGSELLSPQAYTARLKGESR